MEPNNEFPNSKWSNFHPPNKLSVDHDHFIHSKQIGRFSILWWFKCNGQWVILMALNSLLISNYKFSSSAQPNGNVEQQQQPLPIQNVHKLLQAGRSVHSGATPSPVTRATTSNNLGVKLSRNASMDSRRMVQLSTSAVPLNTQHSFNASSTTTRSTSVESGE